MTELSHQQLVQEELAKQELNPGRVKYPPKMSYKKEYDRTGLEEGTQIGFKTPIILEHKNGSGVVGYLLAEVVDWENAEGAYFTGQSCFIARVLEVSNEALEKHVGHLRNCTVARNWMWHSQFQIVNIGRGIWPTYQIKKA